MIEIILGIIAWHILWIIIIGGTTKIGNCWIITPKIIKITYPTLNWFGISMIYLGLWLATPILMIATTFCGYVLLVVINKKET